MWTSRALGKGRALNEATDYGEYLLFWISILSLYVGSEDEL